MSAILTPPNGNDKHKPPFKLAPIESPEQEARTEVLRDIAPKIRRRVREDNRLSAGAKFFFYALFDDAFWHAVGGHGTGQIFADIRTLAERYKHDEKSICRWRDELVEAGWLWTGFVWPMTEWRLTPLMPPPLSSPAKRAVQMALGRSTRAVGISPTTPQNDGTSEKWAENEGAPDDCGQNDPTLTPLCPRPVGIPGGVRGHLGVDLVGIMPTHVGQDAHGLPPECPRTSGKTPTGVGQDAHGQPETCPPATANGARPPSRNGRGEKSPEIGAVGAVEIPNFKRLGNRAKGAGTKRPKRLRTDTEEFLSLVRDVCGPEEAEKNSGLWVTNLHADPALAYEVIHDTASAKKEGRIKTTPARHAMDLWKRRWSEKHPDESVVAAAERRRSQP